MAKIPDTISVRVTWEDSPLTRAIKAEAVAAERHRIASILKEERKEEPWPQIGPGDPYSVRLGYNYALERLTERLVEVDDG